MRLNKILKEKRPMIKRYSSLLFVLFCVFCVDLREVQAVEKSVRPNIIYIMADDLGYGDLGCYGQETIQTPHIDRLAAEGMKFNQFYAGATVCAPSRCVLMTGLHTGHCYIRGNAKLNLRPSDVTVAELLKSAGYTNGLFGKWGVGHEGSTGTPNKQGFDQFFGYLDQHHAHNYYPAYLMENEERYPLENVVPGEGEFGVGVASEKKEYSHDLIVERALQFLEENHGKRFFLYLPITIPHANNQGRQKGMEVPDYGAYAGKDWPEAQKGLAAMIGRMDSDVGRVMQKLKEYGIDENTIVIFTSDNGPHREGGNDPDYFNSNGPLRGIKRALYDGGIRVPFIVRWPGEVKGGSESEHVGYFADFLPTACELAGVEVPKGLDGISFVKALRGEPDQEEHEYLYWEFYEQGSRQAVRFGEWKAIAEPMGSENVELYHVVQDVGEERDLAGEHPEKVKLALKYMKEAHVPAPEWKVRKRKKRVK